MQATFSHKKAGSKRKLSLGRLEALDRARKKRSENAAAKRHGRALEEKKRGLLQRRRGKGYPALVWIVLFTGIINLMLTCGATSWRAAKFEGEIHDVSPVTLHQKFVYFTRTDEIPVNTNLFCGKNNNKFLRRLMGKEFVYALRE